MHLHARLEVVNVLAQRRQQHERVVLVHKVGDRQVVKGDVRLVLAQRCQQHERVVLAHEVGDRQVVKGDVRLVLAQRRQQHERIVLVHEIGDRQVVKGDVRLVVDVAHLEHVANVIGEKHQQLALLANHQIARLQLHDHLDDYGNDWGERVRQQPPQRRQDGRRDVADLLAALIEEHNDARRTGDVKLEHRSEREPPVRLLRARLAHLGDQVRLLAEVRGQGVNGLEPGAVVDLVDRHVNDQVELVKRTPDLNDFKLGAPHHANLDAVNVTHVGLLVSQPHFGQVWG